MRDRTLPDLAVEALDDLKAQDVVVLDVGDLTAMTDFLVIATGRSTRQVKALAENVIQSARASGHRALGVEGLDASEWVLVDLGDAIVHVMDPETRAFYQLEKLWGGREANLLAGVR